MRDGIMWSGRTLTGERHARHGTAWHSAGTAGMAMMKRNGGDEPFLRSSEGLMEGEQQRQTKRRQERRAGRDTTS